MKEVKDSVKSVKIEKNLGEEDVMVDVVDLGETGARVTEDVVVKEVVREAVVVVASGSGWKKSGNGSVKEDLSLLKLKQEAMIGANASKNNVEVEGMEVTLKDVWMTGTESVVGDTVVESLRDEALEGEVIFKDKGAEKGVTDETVEGSTGFVKEVDGVANEKSIKDEILFSAKIPESVALVSDVVNAGTGEGVTENLERKDEADQTSKEESSQSDNAKVDNELKSSVPEAIEEEIVIKEPESERGSPMEIVEQPTGSVEEVADGDHVMDASTVKEDDIDLVVVEDGFEGKDGTQGGVSVELSLDCSDSQNLLSEVVNEGDVDVTDPKADVVAERSKTDAHKVDEVTTVKKELNSGAQSSVESQTLQVNAATDGSKPDVVAYTEPPTIDETNNFQDDQSVLNGGNEITETHIEVPDSTVEVPSTAEHQTYAEHSVLPADLEGEDAGMDIDEVLGWKDEIPGPDISMLEGELKVDLTNLSTYTNDITQSLENEIYVSMQQLNYYSPPENEGQFNVSDLVWGKVRSHLWWPGQIFDLSDASETAMKHHKKDCFLVAYFGDRTFAWNESTVLKPFRSNFSQIEKHSSSESFNIAVDCALEEVSRRVELGLTCSCASPDVYKKIKCQIVKNSGIKEESSRRHGVDKSASVNSFEPDKLVDYMRLLAKFPYGESNKLDLTMAKAQLSSYGRYKGYRELAEFQLCGDLLEEGSEKRPTLHSESAAKPSFKIGASIQKVASQLTAPGDQVFVNADQSNQAEMLSRLHLTARDPMKVNSSSNTIIPFFNAHRSAVLTKSRQNSSEARKRKPSNENDPEEYEFDDVNDSYWTDRIIQNCPEDQLVEENQNESVEHHQLVAYEQAKLHQLQQQQQPVKQTRRSNKKRFFSSNHEIEAKEQLELIERRRQNLATEVLMKYPQGIYFPSEIHLNKMFRRFGPLMESETEVDRQSGRARVVFKKCSDAEVAHNSAGKFNIFGSIIVNYELNYSPLISYKPMPLPMDKDPQDAC